MAKTLYLIIAFVYLYQLSSIENDVNDFEITLRLSNQLTKRKTNISNEIRTKLANYKYSSQITSMYNWINTFLERQYQNICFQFIINVIT